MPDPTAVDAGLLLLRVTVGLTLAAHGFAKVFLGGRLAGTARWFDSMGMRPGALHARLAAFTELGAGLALAAGVLTSLAGAAITATMLVAAWTVHRTHGFFIVRNGWEYNFVLAAVGVSIAVTSPGAWSLDKRLFDGPAVDGWSGLAVAAGFGVAAGIGHLVAFYRPSRVPSPA